MKIRAFDKSIEKFIGSLDKNTGPKVVRTIEFLEEYGPQLRMPHSKKIENNIFELRIQGVQAVKILYVFHKESAVLLRGFIKKSQKTPKRELELAFRKASTLDTQ